MSQDHTYELSGRTFCSPDQASSDALSYNVYAYIAPDGRYESGDVQLLLNNERFFQLSFGESVEEREQYDVLAAFDHLITFFTEARDAYLKAERFLQDHKGK